MLDTRCRRRCPVDGVGFSGAAGRSKAQMKCFAASSSSSSGQPQQPIITIISHILITIAIIISSSISISIGLVLRLYSARLRRLLHRSFVVKSSIFIAS